MTVSRLTATVSGGIMSDPVSCADGHTYERSEIERWLSTGAFTSPSTGEMLIKPKTDPAKSMLMVRIPAPGAKLTHMHVIPNHALRNAIEEWAGKSEQGNGVLAVGRPPHRNTLNSRKQSAPSLTSRLEASEQLERAALEAEVLNTARTKPEPRPILLTPAVPF